jgi:hypothetical protein
MTSKRNRKRAREDLVDLALSESFPASDPPFFMAGVAVLGAPQHDRPAGRRTNAARRGSLN